MKANDLSKNHHPFGTLAPLAAARDTRPTVARGRKTTKYLSLQHAINKNETRNGPKTLKKYEFMGIWCFMMQIINHSLKKLDVCTRS